MTRPAKVGRADIYVDCPCGSEVEFDDASTDGAHETITCDDCGRRIEICTTIDLTVKEPPG